MQIKINLFDDNYLGKKLLLIALSLVLLTHGVILYFTLPKTYDAFVHIFFADHYARFWWEPWDYRWYTGFLTISYPPLVHQAVALISKIFPLKVAFCIYAIIIFEILVIGIYRFTKLFFDKTTAGVAALIAVVLSSLVETLHVFGQMPTLTGLSFLLNSLPFLYQYIVKRKPIYLVMALAFLAVVICSHHVTAIFGMIFFIAPTIFMALVDCLPQDVREKSILQFAIQLIIEAFKKYKQLILFGGLMIILAVGLIFPYWYWSKTDPISQVSIPHGSRDNFLKIFSSGLIFYIVPLTLIIALLPAISYTITRKKRYIGWAVAFFLCLLLGSGGTTPLPKMLLGANAFNILTLDRFGFWASIIAVPFMAKFINSFLVGMTKNFWVNKFGQSNHFVLAGLTGFSYFLFLIFIFHLASFRPMQPKEIEIEPMLNFLNRDDHLRWRFLTLGFGDQMAWLSANSMAASVDGNYHSARRLPELTTRPIERLENAKYSGDEGLASLNDFLANAEKYSLKYVFSNDRYYDPLLYYSGWSRTIRLENGIMVWEKGNISTIKPVVPKNLSPILKKAWGIIPLSSLAITILLTILYLSKFKQNEYNENNVEINDFYPKLIIYPSALMPILFFSGFIFIQVSELLLLKEQKNPKTTVLNYYNHLDFQRFEKAFHFFKPSPTYPIDQYLLEKSVTDGGLLPSYAKLDSINTIELFKNNDSASLQVFTRWRTALGPREKLDTLSLQMQNKKWYILPKTFTPEIPDYQTTSYSFTLFKKMGKRLISSFPTVKDDKVKKPFVAYKQINFVQNGNENFITGEILNADDIAVNIALKLQITFASDTVKNYYPNTTFQYNLSPKESTFFKIPIDNTTYLDLLKIKSITLYAATDISERGYIHGGITNYSVQTLNNNDVIIHTNIFDELSTDINIPGILIAEKDLQGKIWQVKLVLHHTAVRSGLNIAFNNPFNKIENKATIINKYPIKLIINQQERKVLPLIKDSTANANAGIVIKPHCFISQEIYLQ